MAVLLFPRTPLLVEAKLAFAMAVKLGLVLSFAFTCVACDSSVDTSPRDGTITFESLTVTRVTPTASGAWWLNGVLRNHTPYTVNNMHDAHVFAAGARAQFELGTNRPDGRTLVGCLGPNPWDVPPNGQKAIRLRLGLDNDPADFSVACEFSDEMTGVDLSKTRAYQAPRHGSAPAGDFEGEVRIELFATIDDAPCSPDECLTRARAVGVAVVSPAE